MAKKIDTVTVEVVRNLLMSIAEETYGIIVRSAYSTNMKERRDVCTAVIDPDGNSVAQVESLAALLGVTAEQMANVVIAYEPIWAIGTGKTATADQAEEVCGQIRKVIGEVYGEAVAEATTVQYGGSMNAKNCEELLSKKDVDGGLIGGASLKAPDFAVIVNAATKG